ncbi:hypothetical protein IKQ65_00270 [Candidatus Saccharibacteria bacterium]|nr:hypothetical protein [Candidatus Saccharibacteria bacterium]MBR6961474.1 hypothetical protein [Candidatus Saccharibacteria bacterium]
MNINIYKERMYEDVRDKNGSKRLYTTEIGKVTKTTIKKRLVELGPTAFSAAFNRYLEVFKMIPSPQDTLVWEIMTEYYPALTTDELDKETEQKWGNMVVKELLYPILHRFVGKNYTVNKNTKEGKIISEYTYCMFNVFSSAVYVKGDDDHFYHIFDERSGTDEGTLKDVKGLIYDQVKAAREYAIEGIRSAFECGVRKSKDIEIDPMDLAEIVNWYIRVASILDDRNATEKLAKILFEKSQNKEDKDIAIAIFEDNQEKLEAYYKHRADLDFVDRGRYEEYDSVHAFGEAIGMEITEFFAEKDESETERSIKHASNGEKKDNREYGLMILNQIDRLHESLKNVSSQTKVFNIKPNSVKTKKASVFGKYIAVASKIGDEWIILVDSIVPGAIYCWHGKSYLEGLEMYKNSKSYARAQPDVVHKNHNYKRLPISIYLQILNELGISL